METSESTAASRLFLVPTFVSDTHYIYKVDSEGVYRLTNPLVWDITEHDVETFLAMRAEDEVLAEFILTNLVGYLTLPLPQAMELMTSSEFKFPPKGE